MSIVIIGGGVAGAAAACLLGPSALVLERETGTHDKICGEFLSHEAQRYLARLGMDLAALGAAPIHAIRLIHGRHRATARLPFTAAGLSRRTLDAALLARAEALGAEVRRGSLVRGLMDGTVELDGAGRISASTVFLATGKHELRGTRRNPPTPPEELVGLKMYFTLSPAEAADLAGHVEVVLFQGGYAGLQMVEGGTANLCLLMRRERFEAVGRSWPGVQDALERECPHLRGRLQGAIPLLGRPLTIFRVPYGYVHAPGPHDVPGVFRLGDQACVIPSFSGDGVSIALHTAFAAVAACRAGSARDYHAHIRGDVAGQIGRASMLYRAARASPGLMVAAARLWPGALPWAARLTRIPGWALAAQGIPA